MLTEKIAVIGAGWYGAHTAISLAEKGYDVTLYEKNPKIFNEISGNFGIRLHAGPHYPRSKKTRESCIRGFNEFKQRYPELVITNSYSRYGLGELDADNMPSKVGIDIFKSVCQESKKCDPVDLQANGYSNLISAMDIEEASIAVGHRVRNFFEKRLTATGVKLVCNFNVTKLDERGDKIAVVNQNNSEKLYDYVVNTTSYQSLLENDIPFNLDIVYQPCLALIYQDKFESLQPLSFIVVDGWFPCIMPLDDKANDEFYKRSYILTHGKWTIMGSFKSVSDAKNCLNEINDEFIKNKIKSFCESEMDRFWPEFSQRFQYTGWKGAVLAKIKTNKEFRSAVTFEKNKIIYVIPGKVSNIFDVEREVVSLIEQKNMLIENNFKYIQGGVLHESIQEITEKFDASKPNTCTLQTFNELQKKEKTTLLNRDHKLPKCIFWKPHITDTKSISSQFNKAVNPLRHSI